MAASARCADWTPDPSLDKPADRVRLYEIGRHYCDTNFDPSVGLVLRDVRHSAPHLIRESAYYAHGLLMTKDPADREKAIKILRLVLSKQDLRKDQFTYGSYLPYYEDDWKTVVNPDANYAQFIGLSIASAIDIDNKQNHVLPPDLRKDLENSFRLAVESTIRRDVAPDYTNISMLSAAVGAAGDKLLNIPGAKDFAMSKLTWILARADRGMCFTEYLSPTYYATGLGSAYTIKEYASSPDIDSAADRIIGAYWKDIAASYHAPTFQLGGPHSRSYGENMLEYAAALKYMLVFALDGKYPISSQETAHSWDCAGLMDMATMKFSVRPEFKQAPVPWREVPIANRNGMVIRQYREGDLMMGSMSEQSVWQQQRNMVAYWPSNNPQWHVAYCQDFSPTTLGNGYAHFHSTQVKGAVLAALTGKLPSPPKGGLMLEFNGEATEGGTAAGLNGEPHGSCKVSDGDVTAYIYPVTANAEGAMAFRKDEKRAYVERMWNSADHFGNFGVLSYLVVFKTKSQQPPVVKNISLTSSGNAMTAGAEVDGAPMSITFSN